MRTVTTSLAVPPQLISMVSHNLVSHDAVVSARILMETHTVSAEQNPWVCFALAVVLENPSTGNSCVRVEELATWLDSDTTYSDSWLTHTDQWMKVLSAHPTLITQDPNSVQAPFVLDGHALYSQKSYAEESFVAQRLQHLLVNGQLQVITGGPGSGKTTSIAKRLIEYVSQPHNAGASIALAAPTGLAAKRMKFALANAMDSPEIASAVSHELRERILDLPKSTVHKLLQYNPSSRQQYGRNAKNLLEVNLVIIDEVSMMPLSMMAHLLQALPAESHLILVGDKDQLASVESGSVLADICLASEMGPQFVESMRGKFRFAEGSPVATLSDAINTNSTTVLHAAIAADYPSGVDESGKPLPMFHWVNPLTDAQGLKDVVRQVLHHARKVCDTASQAITDSDMQQLLDLRDQLQLICAHRNGKFGVAGWNSTIDRKLGARARGQWYVGRPIMVRVNDYVNDLSNGDIGIVCIDEQQQRIAVFSGNNGIRRIPVSKLPPVETVHALTIHKSQGSEYGHTIVVLPLQPSRIVTRELVYTGITRAKPDLTLVATPEVLENAASTNIRRATGLADRLYDMLTAHEDKWPFVPNV